MAFPRNELTKRINGANAFHDRPALEKSKPTGPAGKANLRHLVVAVRLEAREREGVTLALRMAAAHQARVTLLHVLEPFEPSSFHWLDAIDSLHRALTKPPRDSAAAIASKRADIAAFLEREIPAELRDKVDVQCECRIGDIATEVARFAEEQAADLLLLCSCPSSWRPTLWPGLSRRIANLLPKPVILAHARA